VTANLEQAAAYSILVDGVALSQDHHDRLKEIRVVDDVRLPDVCTIELSYPEGDGVDSQPFEIGKPLEVRLGAASERAPQTLFRGQIVTLLAGFASGGCAVTVRAYDRSHILHRARRVRTFQNQTTSDIVTKVLREAGLGAKCDASGEPHEFVQQDNETDWDFILRLADRAGLEFVVRDQVGELRKPSVEGAVDLRWPDTLRAFSPRVTAVQQVQEVTLRTHNPKTKQAIEATATRPQQIAQIGMTRDSVAVFDDASIHVATEPVQTQGEATALAQALLDKLANGYIAADGVAPGNPRIRAGVSVNIAGVGTKFSGTYRVAHSMHVLRVGAYETRFANSATHTVTGVVGGGGDRAPSFGAHLVLGIVTNNNDPEGLGRVRVQFPALGDELESAWARIATASAGDARGLLMLPVVGEEVLVGFEHQDTRRPYVLGSLFNGKDKPGDDLLQGKDGSFALHSDHKIFVESAEDHTLHSGGQLVVKVDGNVDEKFGGGWTNDTSASASLTAGASFEIEGQKVTISGMTALELSCGAASIKLSPAGVQISGPTITMG
jgi:phage protein D/phage baseplate assembly protein gpV